MTQTEKTERLKEELYEDFMRLKGIIQSGKKESRKIRSAKKSSKDMIIEQEEAKRQSSNSRQSKQKQHDDGQIQQYHPIANLIINTPLKHSPVPNSEQYSSSISSSPYSSLLEQYTNHYQYSIKKFYNLKNSQSKRKRKHQSASKLDFNEESIQKEVKKKLLFNDKEDGQTHNRPQTSGQIHIERQIQQLSISTSQRLQQNVDSRPLQIQNLAQIDLSSLLGFKTFFAQIQQPLENLSSRLNSISSNLNLIKSKLAKSMLSSKFDLSSKKNVIQAIESQLKGQHIPSFEQFEKQLQIQQHQRNYPAQQSQQIPSNIQTQPFNLQNLPQSDSSCDIQHFNDQLSHYDENSILSENLQDNIQHKQNL